MIWSIQLASSWKKAAVMNNLHINNRITGPSPLPDTVQKAIARQSISHRSDEFRKTVSNVRQGLMPLFGCTLPPLLFTSSGTAALESTIVNLVRHGDKILALSIGYYGDLYASMARHYFFGMVDHVVLECGDAFDEDNIEKIFQVNCYDIVLITHNESSTGCVQPLGRICHVIRNMSDALIMVDAVSSIGCVPFEFDAWHIDVAVTVTQKGLMAPPGMSIVTLSNRAFSRAIDAKKNIGTSIGSVAFDYLRCAEALDKDMVLTTPSLQSFWGLEAALCMISAEGLKNVFRRHYLLSELTIKSVELLGLSILPAHKNSSPSVTAIKLPKLISSNDVLRVM
ncbi:MAG: alanine--glyoxylate aminotransferase family protein, partial [Sphingobacteriales bacterium]